MIRSRVVDWSLVLGSLVLLAVIAGASCKSPSALVELDVTSDQKLPNVNLTLTANGGDKKSFRGIALDPTLPYQVGMLVASPSGAVTIAGIADDGTCVVAEGMVPASGVSGGGTVGPISLRLATTTTCLPIPQGTGGDNRGAGGNGGVEGGGSGGAGGVIVIGGSGGVVVSGGGGMPGGGTGGVILGAGGTGACGDLIDDMESNTGYICTGDGRAGHWFTYVDAYAGSSITPPPTLVPAPPSLISPPRGTSHYAMRASGGASSYAGIACLVNNAVIGSTPKTFDATKYTGVRFTAKGTGGLKLIVQTSATESTAYGGTCNLSSCYGATSPMVGYPAVCYGSSYPPSLQADTWTTYSIPFTCLADGNAAFRKSDVWSIEFQPASTGPFDLWVDDVSFY